MPVPLKKAVVTSLLFLLKGLRSFGRALWLLFRGLSVPFRLFWKYALRPLAFWIYQVLMRARISTGRVLPPVRRTFFNVFGHRYIVHGMMAIIVFFVAGTNLQARGAELGHESTQTLMYELLSIASDGEAQEAALTEGQGEFVESSSDTLEAEFGNDGLLTYAYDQTGVASPYLMIPDTSEPEGEHLVISAPTTYTVQDGDTISGIAKKYGISINTILWANGMTARSLIRPGQNLTILPTTGVLHKVKSGETLGVIAKKYGTDVEKIMASNQIASAQALRIGQELVIPDGTPPAPPAAPKPKPAPVRLADVKEIFRPPTEAPPPKAAEEGYDLVWPTDQKRINQYYKWGHQGLDINGSLKDATYAVDAGIVTFAGWNSGGYGNMILIDHGNGMVTRYAHHSKLYVKEGDQVAKGQTIGMVGSTGRSTGPHLHFEIYVNGKRHNPFEYYR